MAYPLTTGGAVGCAHPPGAVKLAGTAKLKVKGNPVLRRGDLVDAMVQSCAPPGSPPPPPCTKVAAVTAGEALKLRAGGAPVLLDTLAGTSVNANAVTFPLSSAQAGQTRLSAV
ncbi:hypothetical protein OG562_01855 [Streptomyces sp. NBC_01275]|uniref:hypothetical protein n=1 Tax=Streptomyces sp. NBC_01275 TaxID=2903807 RepID=UPI0022515744|nr:hypothetical protein [Streptomyces sp. NBC_01275]MCX4759751.1 hypothetical protein [Streptomyces sp. NBC_01275]